MTAEVALFVDLENITTAMWKNFGQRPDPFNWLEKARKYGPVAFARAYGDFTQPHLARLEQDLRAVGIEKFDCPTKQRGESTQSTVDSNIIIDLYEVALDRPGIKIFLLMAGDSDYIRVVTRLRYRLDKDVVIAGVPGSTSRDLVRAAGRDDPLEPLALESQTIDELGLIRVIERFQSTLTGDLKPTFGRMLNYVSDPRNAEIVSAQIAQSVLNDFVNRGVLIQESIELPDGRGLRVTRLNYHDDLVQEALDI